MNIFACMLQNVHCYFSANLGTYSIDPIYSSKSFFFLRIVCFGYHCKMTFLSFSLGLLLILMKYTDVKKSSRKLRYKTNLKDVSKIDSLELHENIIALLCKVMILSSFQESYLSFMFHANCIA